MSAEQSSVIKIEQKIVGYKVVDKNQLEKDRLEREKVQAAAAVAKAQRLEVVHEKLSRPDFLMGSTYKIKTPIYDHSLFITINDILLNQGTEHEQRHPYEIFINSKNMDHFMWVVALTRVISAVFRKGGDVTFMVKELKEVFDPKGGYFKKGGKFMPSLVAEIGEALESHLKMIGLIENELLDEHQRQALDAKRAEYEQSRSTLVSDAVNDDSGFPKGAVLCNKCLTKASIVMDGCATCLNCGDSKCS